jgi:predicted Zn-dependent peptidase
MHKFKLTKLNNGLRILTVPSKESLSFQVMVLVNTGADFETKANNGISHFLEHMCFKGTKKRPSNLDIVKELDRVGGYYNAATGRERTRYYARAAKQYQDLALDMVSDIYLNSQFPEKEIKKEKGVILGEINMYQDNPQDWVWEIWGKLLYGNQPIGRSVLGTKTNIKKFKREDFLRYRASQYRAKSTLVVISGNFKEKEVLGKVKNYFCDISSGKAYSKKPIKEKQNKPQVFWQNRKINQTHFVLGFRGINYFDKRRYALAVLDAIFDGGMSSILFQTIRQKLGVAYYIYSTISRSTDYGFWAVAAGIDSNRLEEVVSSVLGEWKKFKTKPIDIKDIKRAKSYITGKLALGLENVHNVAMSFAFQELLKQKIETPSEYLKKIKQVTAHDIQKVAEDLLKSQSLNLAIVGPYKNKQRLQKLLHV